MFAGAFEAGSESDQIALAQRWSDRHGHEFRLAFRQRARLVEDECVDLLHGLERFGILEEDPGLCAASGADHDGHGRGQAESAWAGNDEHGDRIHDRVGETRFGTPDGPGGKRERGDRNHGGDKPCSHLVGKTLNRGACALRRLTNCTICASIVSLPTRSARMTKDPVPFTVAPVTLLPESFRLESARR